MGLSKMLSIKKKNILKYAVINAWKNICLK